jgi:hypothetical protein
VCRARNRGRSSARAPSPRGTVRVGSGERQDEGRLPMVDVAGGRDDPHRAQRRRTASSTGSTVRRSHTTSRLPPADDTRRPERAVRSLTDGARPNAARRDGESRQGPPPATASVSTTFTRRLAAMTSAHSQRIDEPPPCARAGSMSRPPRSARRDRLEPQCQLVGAQRARDVPSIDR